MSTVRDCRENGHGNSGIRKRIEAARSQLRSKPTPYETRQAVIYQKKRVSAQQSRSARLQRLLDPLLRPPKPKSVRVASRLLGTTQGTPTPTATPTTYESLSTVSV